MSLLFHTVDLLYSPTGLSVQWREAPGEFPRPVEPATHSRIDQQRVSLEQAERHGTPAALAAAAAQLDEFTLHHLRSCSTCRAAWYKVGAFPAGCTDPRLGALTLHALSSRPPDPRVHAHLEHCMACRLRLLQASRATSASM